MRCIHAGERVAQGMAGLLHVNWGGGRGCIQTGYRERVPWRAQAELRGEDAGEKAAEGIPVLSAHDSGGDLAAWPKGGRAPWGIADREGGSFQQVKVSRDSLRLIV